MWEGFAETMVNVARWNGWFREHDDLIVKARTTADIRKAKEDGRTAIILGFQNTSAFEDKLGAVQLFKDVGVGIAQLTYNTQNLAGSGCYESRDSGLSDWGRELVAEMNRVGMLIDLSHVGSRTSRRPSAKSSKPVAYTHCLPSALKPHPRNKGDGELRFIAEQGGMIGGHHVSAFLKGGENSTVDDYVDANRARDRGRRRGLGRLRHRLHPGLRPGLLRLDHQRTRATPRSLIKFTPLSNPEGVETIGQLPNLTAAWERAGWTRGASAR